MRILAVKVVLWLVTMAVLLVAVRALEMAGVAVPPVGPFLVGLAVPLGAVKAYERSRRVTSSV